MLHSSRPDGRAAVRVPTRRVPVRAALTLLVALVPLTILGTAGARASTGVFWDGFEAGSLSSWSSVATASGGSAYAEKSVVKSGSWAAYFAGTTSTGSVAYARRALGPYASLDTSLDLRVTAEGAAGSNVPILKLFSATGSRIVTLYRQNGTGGQVWVQDKATYLKSTGVIALGTWVHVDLLVIPTGSSSSTLAVSLNGSTVFSSSSANLGNDWPGIIQIGNEVGGQAFAEYVDNVYAASGASAPAPSSTIAPAPTATPTPTPTPTSGWKNVINDQFGSLSSIPSHWTLYNGRYGSSPGNCAVPSHEGVWGGALHLQMYYQSSGTCGAGWYTGGMKLSATYGSVDQRITVSFRVVNNGAVSHYIIPMRWPTTASWPQGGEEDYCERDAALGSCATFLHYSTSSTTQIYHGFNPDLSQWHTLRAQRLNHVVTIWLDNMSTPVWTYYGSSTTLPDTVKTVVLQQECLVTGCPSGTSGSEDLQIAWITVDNPS